MTRTVFTRKCLSVLGGFFALGCMSVSASENVSFRNEVMAVLSKSGCNAGACHGNANGKAGFKLSLRGEDAVFDFNALTRDEFGRRIDALAPERSLILQKATAELGHEGGKRFEKDSLEYRLLRDWIAQGAADDVKTARKLVRIEVEPREKILAEPEDSAQIRVTAFFSDGSSRAVNDLAVFEQAANMASVSPDGTVKRDRFGESTVLARYLHCQEPARLAFVPQRPDFRWPDIAPNNYIDEHIFAKLRDLRTLPSSLCSDETFLRRAFLDVTGILPTAEEARQFAADSSPDKRLRLVSGLLKRPEFADFWALKWADLFRLEERALDAKGVRRFHEWIRESISRGKPLDQFAREIIAARGSTYEHPEANYYRANRNAVERGEAAAQVFLGTRLQCAQCHNHPFDRWTQDDYYNWSALFARVQYKILENRRQDENDSHEFKGEQIVYISRSGELKNPRTGRAAEAAFLLGKPLPEENDEDELEALADWMTAPENPFFAKAQVNRIWFHLMGRGIVDPIDDFRATNPASDPALLDALARDFAQHKFDLRRMIALIMSSKAYQLSSAPNETNADDETNYSRGLIRRLTAEQLFDCQHQASGVPPSFNGYPDGFRAAQLPGAGPERIRGRRMVSAPEKFLEQFGKPPRLLTCECERSNETTMGQAFQMISGPTLNQLLAEEDNRIGQLVALGRSDTEIIEELYLSSLTRLPADAERAAALALLQKSASRRAALEDILWSLLNAKEFVLRP